MQQLGRIGLIILEVAILSALILATRCANYQDVFVGGNVYFIDGDCYARMTRVRMCSEHPGLIVRHHDFENFPAGTTPHTTAPFDYLILALSILLKPFTAFPIDLAGAFVSPLLALIGGWFLWWWSRRIGFRYRWAMLILYAISPILVHGTELGRPDHQSLLILLVTIAICAEWILQCDKARAIEVQPSPSYGSASNRPYLKRWSIVSGIAWGLAVWVSAYEPLVLLLLMLLILLACHAVARRRRVIGATNSGPHPNLLPAGEGSPPPIGSFGRDRRTSWIFFFGILALALIVERRVPSLPIFSSSESFRNWARTIGELAHVSPANPIWLSWVGYLILVAPFLIWMGAITSTSTSTSKSGRGTMVFIVPLLVATYGLTIWQARWGYFFVLIFAIALPTLLEPIKSRAAVWVALVLSVYPILRDWDERLWPSGAEVARRVEQRNESVQLRDLAISLKSSESHPFLAPWWLSSSIAYWSGQPGVGGSSHESLDGNVESARFFLTEDWGKAREILENHKIAWVFGYDSQRVAQNSSAILGVPVPGHALCFVLDRTSTQVPRFLIFSGQNGAGKLYRVANKL